MWTTIIGGVIGFFTKKSEQKARLTEARLVAEEKRIERGMDSAGWKDEWIVLLVSYPYILAFIPNEAAQKAAQKGFVLLSQFPDWWTYTFISIVGSVFGIKKLINWKGGMK